MRLAGRGGAFEPKVPSPVPEGHVLAGKYRMEKVIGAGGMGVVMSATHIHIGQRVAIKFLLPHALCDEQTLERFAREARALAQIESEHVGRVIDVGELESGQPYTVLECLTGRNLAELMDARGALDIDEAVGYILEACQAMAEAHALGIIHRDLKPENLFLAERADGSRIIKVIDFGVSKISAESVALRIGGRVTTTSAVVGSPLYMSPEQLRAARDVDARTDIWALGVTLYELLTGQGPFRWTTLPELCAAILKDAPRPLRELRSSVPEGLEAVVMGCLEKDPARRPPSAAALALELRPFASMAAVPPGGRSAISPAAISMGGALFASTLSPSLGPQSMDLPAPRAQLQAAEASVTASFSEALVSAPLERASIEPAPVSEPRVEGTMRRSTLTPPVGLAAVTSVRPFKIGRLGALKVALTALVAVGAGVSVILAASTAQSPASAASTAASDEVALARAPSASAVPTLPSPEASASAAEAAKPSPASSMSAAAPAAPAPPPPERKRDPSSLSSVARPPRSGGSRPPRPSYPQSAFDHRK